ncbi:hypothetical protein CFN78_28230, partial [Amycolatopsis antarctica]
AALAEWWRVRDQLPGERANLVAAAWRTAGIRNVRQLAAAAGVDRGTIYGDLEARGIDPGNRAAPILDEHDAGGLVSVVLASFGHLHLGADRDGFTDPREADLVVDVRELLRDPHVDPGMRQLTGRDEVVRDRVLATPGAAELVEHVAAATLTLARVADQRLRLVRVSVGCAGGRHRSVVLADAIAERVALTDDRSVAVVHYDLARPVVGHP